MIKNVSVALCSNELWLFLVIPRQQKNHLVSNKHRKLICYEILEELSTNPSMLTTIFENVETHSADSIVGEGKR